MTSDNSQDQQHPATQHEAHKDPRSPDPRHPDTWGHLADPINSEQFEAFMQRYGAVLNPSTNYADGRTTVDTKALINLLCPQDSTNFNLLNPTPQAHQHDKPLTPEDVEELEELEDRFRITYPHHHWTAVKKGMRAICSCGATRVLGTPTWKEPVDDPEDEDTRTLPKRKVHAIHKGRTLCGMAIVGDVLATERDSDVTCEYCKPQERLYTCKEAHGDYPGNWCPTPDAHKMGERFPLPEGPVSGWYQQHGLSNEPASVTWQDVADAAAAHKTQEELDRMPYVDVSNTDRIYLSPSPMQEKIEELIKYLKDTATSTGRTMLGRQWVISRLEDILTGSHRGMHPDEPPAGYDLAVGQPIKINTKANLDAKDEAYKRGYINGWTQGYDDRSNR